MFHQGQLLERIAGPFFLWGGIEEQEIYRIWKNKKVRKSAEQYAEHGSRNVPKVPIYKAFSDVGIEWVGVTSQNPEPQYFQGVPGFLCPFEYKLSTFAIK